MGKGEFVKRVIFPEVSVIFLAKLFMPLCMEHGELDYLKLWFLIGIPFGIHRMFFLMIPKGYDIGGTMGVLMMNLLIGSVNRGNCNYMAVWSGNCLFNKNGGYRDSVPGEK